MFISVNIVNIVAIGLPSQKGTAVDELNQAQLTKSSRGLVNWIFFVDLSDSVLFYVGYFERLSQCHWHCHRGEGQSQIGLGRL